MTIVASEDHALRKQLEPVLAASPLQAGPLYTALHDLALAVEWHDVRVFELFGTGWTGILGHKRRDDPLRLVIPLPLHTTALKPSSLRSIFYALASLSIASTPAPLDPLVPSLLELKAELARRRQRPPVVSDDPGADTPDQSTVETRNEREDGDDEDVPLGTVNEEIDRSLIYMAIVTGDSTVVYYKLSKGIVKPRDVPDE